MSSWTTSVSDLRTKLSDGETDKLRSFKPVFGVVDGTNIRFKTLEYRRTTDFTVTGQDPLGVYRDGILLDPTTEITSDDPGTGFFKLVTAPSGRQQVECTYYMRWFLDSELQEFLRLAMNWLGLGDDYTLLDMGLRPAALAYAAAEAYQKLTLRWTESISSNFRLEDAPNAEQRTPVDYYKSLTEMFRKEAYKERDAYYSRQGQSLAPLRGYVRGVVPPVVPGR